MKERDPKRVARPLSQADSGSWVDLLTTTERGDEGNVDTGVILILTDSERNTIHLRPCAEQVRENLSFCSPPHDRWVRRFGSVTT